VNRKRNHSYTGILRARLLPYLAVVGALVLVGLSIGQATGQTVPGGFGTAVTNSTSTNMKVAAAPAGSEGSVVPDDSAESTRAVAVNSMTGKVYFANRDNNITAIDGITKHATRLNSGGVPIAMEVHPVTGRLYVLHRGSNDLTVLDGNTGAADTIPVGTRPVALAINPVTNKVYVANAGSQDVTVMDGDGSHAQTIKDVNAKLPWAIAVNPGSNRIYVANRGSSNVTIIDGNSGSTQTIATGTGPVAVAVNPGTRKVYVANAGSNDVSVIDERTGETSTITDIEALHPVALAVDPVSDRIYVANGHSRNVTIIGGATGSLRTVRMQDAPQAVVLEPATATAYVISQQSDEFVTIDGQK
jgi:YVTN family beta-propeller protein